MKFLHSMIRVNNLENSMKFYQELLGLKLQNKKDLDDCTLYFLAEFEGAPEIELTDNWQKPSEPYSTGSTFGHFAFETDDMDAFSNKVKELGYNFLYEPYTLELKGQDGSIGKKTIAFIKDPDGNEIEIIQKS